MAEIPGLTTAAKEFLEGFFREASEGAIEKGAKEGAEELAERAIKAAAEKGFTQLTKEAIGEFLETGLSTTVKESFEKAGIAISKADLAGTVSKIAGEEAIEGFGEATGREAIIDGAKLKAPDAAPATAPSGAGPTEPPVPPKSTAAAGAAGEGPIRVPKIPAEEVEMTLADLDKLDLTQAKTRETLFSHKKTQAQGALKTFKESHPGWESNPAAVDYVGRMEDNIVTFRSNESAVYARAKALEKTASGPTAPVKAPAPTAGTPAPGTAAPTAGTPAPGTPAPTAGTPAPGTAAPTVSTPPITAPIGSAGAAVPPPLPAAPAPQVTGWRKVGKWFEDLRKMQPGRPAGPAVSQYEPGLISTRPGEIIDHPTIPNKRIENPDSIIPPGVKVLEARPGSQLGKYNEAGHDNHGIGHFEFLDVKKIGVVFERMLKKSNVGKPSEFIDGGFVFDETAKSTSLVSNFLNAAKQVHGPRRFANLGGGEINTGYVAAAADEMQRSVDKFIKQFCERHYNKCIDVGDVQGAKNAKQVLEQYIKDSTETRWKSLGFKDAVNESTLNKVKPSLLAKAEEANASTLGKASPKAIGLAISGHVVNAVSLGGELAVKAVKSPLIAVEMLPYYIKAPAKVILSLATIVGLGLGLKKTGEGVVDVYDAGKQKVEEVKELAHKVGDTYDKATKAIDTAHKKLDGALETFAEPGAGNPAAEKPAPAPKVGDDKVDPNLFKKPEAVPSAPLIPSSGGTPEPTAPAPTAPAPTPKSGDNKLNPSLFKKTSMVEPQGGKYSDMAQVGAAKPTAIVDARLTNASKPIELS